MRLQKVDEHLNRNSEHAEKVFKKSIAAAHNHNVKLILRSLKPYSSRCIIPWFAPYVGIKGDVFPCCSIGMNDPQATATEYCNNIPITHNVMGYSAGNIMDSRLSKIWNGEKLNYFRKALKEVNFKNKENYSRMIKEQTTELFYCKVCPIRWNYSC